MAAFTYTTSAHLYVKRKIIGCALAHRLWHTAIDVWCPPFYSLPRRMRQHPQRGRARVGVALAISHPMQNRHPVGQPSITPITDLIPLPSALNKLKFAAIMMDNHVIAAKSQSLPPPQPSPASQGRGQRMTLAICGRRCAKAHPMIFLFTYR